MEQKNLWKNVVLLTIGTLFAFSVKVVRADDTKQASTDNPSSESCVLTDNSQ